MTGPENPGRAGADIEPCGRCGRMIPAYKWRNKGSKPEDDPGPAAGTHEMFTMFMPCGSGDARKTSTLLCTPCAREAVPWAEAFGLALTVDPDTWEWEDGFLRPAPEPEGGGKDGGEFNQRS